MEPGVKKLLVISWAMPPMVFPRSIQVARTLMALDRLGWKSTVLCVDRINVPDETPVDPELERLYGASYRIVPVSVDIGIDKQSDASQDIWIRPAVRAAADLLRGEQYSAILTFAQPWVDHLVGLKLQTRFRLPWIAHFSDPWVDSLYYTTVDPKMLKKWRRQERMVIAHADAVVFTNEAARDLVMRKYPREWHHKTRIVPHGYDPCLISPVTKSIRRTQRLRMIYTGSLYKERSVQSLLDAIAGLSSEMELKDRLELAIIGPTEKMYPEKAKEMGLEDIVTFPGRMSYMESLRAIARADVPVVIEAPNAEPNPFLPSKLVDYLMLNKPKNVMSTLDDPGGRTTVKDFLHGVSVRVFPVGRLDFDSEGLMLLTNNGDLAQALLHPRYHVPKTYLIKVKGVLTDDEIADLQRGVKLEDGMTSPATVKKIKKAEANSWVEITIHEGRKHQVKRMLETVGHPVIKLTRVKMGPLTLGGLTSGEFRFLTDREANALREVVDQRRTLEQAGKDLGVRPPRPKRREGWAKPAKTK